MHIDIREALRYLGVRGDPDEGLLTRMTSLSVALMARCTPRWVWRCADVSRADGLPSLEDIALPGRTAARMLSDCRRAAVLVCTLGAEFEGWVRQTQLRDMSDAVMLDALGSAWAEAGCDAAEQEIAARFPGMFLTDRFSPGYGDLPLDIQPALLTFSDARRRVGVTSTDRLLLLPQKSVTAIIGIADRPQMARIRSCAHCRMHDTCTLRKVGKTCDI